MAAPTTYIASEEEEEDDVVEYFAAAFQDSTPAAVQQEHDHSRSQDGALVILEGDRAGDDPLPTTALAAPNAPTQTETETEPETEMALTTTTAAAASDPPTHPVQRMQAAFEESILEAAGEQSPMRRDVPADPKVRHLRMLDEEEYNSSYNLGWRHDPLSQHHPLSKLMAQIAFGVHLLQQRMAKSNEEVMRILQTHVDEVDGWVETTKEDLDHSLADIRERILHLKTPLEHVKIFDSMLEDRDFRTSILEGNHRIERMVNRTNVALNDCTIDVHQGNQATLELSTYLEQLATKNLADEEELVAIMAAMRGNADGWLDCFRTLQAKANTLGLALQQLRGILSEMAKRASLAGRKSVVRLQSAAASSMARQTSSATNSPRATSTSLVTQPPISRYSHSNHSTGTLTSLAARSFYLPNKPLPPPPASPDEDDNSAIAASESALLASFPMRDSMQAAQMVLRRPRTTEDVGMRTETGLWDVDEEGMLRRDDRRPTPPRTARSRAGEGRKSIERRRSRSRARTRSKSRTRSKARMPEKPRETKTEASLPLRSKLSAKLKGKGSTPTLAPSPKKSGHSRADSLHKTLTRTWSLRSPKATELSDSPMVAGGGHNRTDSAGSVRRYHTVSERAPSRTGGPTDSAYASRPSVELKASQSSAEKPTRAQSPQQLAIEAPPLDTRSHSPTALRALSPIAQASESASSSQRNSQQLVVFPAGGPTSPPPPSTRSGTPNRSSRPTMSWGKSSFNDANLVEEKATEIDIEPEPWRQQSSRLDIHDDDDDDRDTPRALPRVESATPQPTTSAAKKRLGMLKAIFRWRIERVHRTDGRSGTSLSFTRT